MRAIFSAFSTPSHLLCGAVSVAMLAMQGASFLATKTEGEVARARVRSAPRGAHCLVVLFSIAGPVVTLSASMALSCRATSIRRVRPIRSGKA